MVWCIWRVVSEARMSIIMLIELPSSSSATTEPLPLSLFTNLYISYVIRFDGDAHTIRILRGEYRHNHDLIQPTFLISSTTLLAAAFLRPNTPSASSVFLYFLFISVNREESSHPHLYTDPETEKTETTTTSATFDFKTTEQERDHWKEKYDEVRDLFEDAKMEVGESPVFLLGFFSLDRRVRLCIREGGRKAGGDRLTDLGLSFLLSMVLVVIVRHRLCSDDALLVA